jgi:hypothetical protein
VLHKNDPKAAEAYDMGGSTRQLNLRNSGAVKKVMDFFRRRGRDRAREVWEARQQWEEFYGSHRDRRRDTWF